MRVWLITSWRTEIGRAAEILAFGYGLNEGAAELKLELQLSQADRVVYDSRMSSPEKPRSRRFDSLSQEAFLNLWRTYDRLRVHEEELFGGYDLTPQQYNALRLLRREHPGNIPTLALASRLVSRAPDITRLLDRLVERGLIERERRPDNRRVVRVGITAAGLELLKTMEGDIKRCHERQLGHLSQEQLHQLIALLREARKPHEPADSTWL